MYTCTWDEILKLVTESLNLISMTINLSQCEQGGPHGSTRDQCGQQERLLGSPQTGENIKWMKISIPYLDSYSFNGTNDFLNFFFLHFWTMDLIFCDNLYDKWKMTVALYPPSNGISINFFFYFDGFPYNLIDWRLYILIIMNWDQPQQLFDLRLRLSWEVDTRTYWQGSFFILSCFFHLVRWWFVTRSLRSSLWIMNVIISNVPAVLLSSARVIRVLPAVTLLSHQSPHLAGL